MPCIMLSFGVVAFQELDAKAVKAALKALEKEKKARAPTEKKLSENPALEDDLAASVAALEADMALLTADSAV